MRGIMKKFAVLMLALASLGAMTGCDDDDDSVKVPAAVQDTFGRMFPGADMSNGRGSRAIWSPNSVKAEPTCRRGSTPRANGT